MGVVFAVFDGDGQVVADQVERVDLPCGGEVADKLVRKHREGGLRLQLLQLPSGVSPDESLVSCATTRPLPNFFSTTSGWLFRSRAMTCTLPSFGGSQSSWSA